MTVAEYMNLRCICGAPRREHAHAYDDQLTPEGIWNDYPTKLRVVGVANDCKAFTWELERELGGKPLANKHLRPLMVEGD